MGEGNRLRKEEDIVILSDTEKHNDVSLWLRLIELGQEIFPADG
jgi:hypothetical protein